MGTSFFMRTPVRRPRRTTISLEATLFSSASSASDATSCSAGTGAAAGNDTLAELNGPRRDLAAGACALRRRSLAANLQSANSAAASRASHSRRAPLPRSAGALPAHRKRTAAHFAAPALRSGARLLAVPLLLRKPAAAKRDARGVLRSRRAGHLCFVGKNALHLILRVGAAARSLVYRVGHEAVDRLVQRPAVDAKLHDGFAARGTCVCRSQLRRVRAAPREPHSRRAAGAELCSPSAPPARARLRLAPCDGVRGVASFQKCRYRPRRCAHQPLKTV